MILCSWRHQEPSSYSVCEARCLRTSKVALKAWRNWGKWRFFSSPWKTRKIWILMRVNDGNINAHSRVDASTSRQQRQSGKCSLAIVLHICLPGLPQTSATQLYLDAPVLLIDPKPNQVNHQDNLSQAGETILSPALKFFLLPVLQCSRAIGECHECAISGLAFRGSLFSELQPVMNLCSYLKIKESFSVKANSNTNPHIKS